LAHPRRSPVSCCRSAIVQSRRHHDVLHVCKHLHRADLSHRNAARDQLAMLATLMITSKVSPVFPVLRWW
jgi:hypothetical protein